MIDFRLPTVLFGGAFDPIHEGHLFLANEVRKQIQIENLRIIFVPANQSPGKAPAKAPGKLRLDWIKMVAEPEGFGVWDEEIRRAGTSFTVDTLEAAHKLGAERAKLHLVIGADAYSHFDQWKSPARIRELTRILVVNRPNYPLAQLHPEDRALTIPPQKVSSTAIREALASGIAYPDGLPRPIAAALEKLLPANNPYVRGLP